MPGTDFTDIPNSTSLIFHFAMFELCVLLWVNIKEHKRETGRKNLRAEGEVKINLLCEVTLSQISHSSES